MNHEALACTLGNQEFRERREFITKEISKGVIAVRELANGFALQFPSTTPWLKNLTDFIEFERVCCPFLRFGLSIPPLPENVSLVLTGPAATKEFIRITLGLLPLPKE